MAEEQNALPPDHDPLLNAGSTAVTEAELDGVLERAASQLTEIAKNVGEGQPRVENLETADDGLTESEVPDVDQQLDHIDILLRTTSQELGITPGAPTGGGVATQAPSASRPEPVSAAIPDFMAEFTSPSPATEAAPARPVPRPNPDPVTTSNKIQPAASSAPKLTAANQGPSPTPPSSSARVGPLSRVADAGIQGLEQVDRWTGFMGPTARWLVGWLAVLMFIGALLVFILG